MTRAQLGDRAAVAVRLAGALMSLLPFALAYAAGTAWQQLRSGWARGRADTRAMHEAD